MKAVRLVALMLFTTLLLAQSYLLTIHNPNGYDLREFQVKVKLPDELKGKPISVYDLSNNPIPFCYETSVGECTTDYTQGDGYIWIKVPFIPTNGDVKLIVSVGSNGAVKGDQVFDFYDDFNDYYTVSDLWKKWEVARSLTGYKGCVRTTCRETLDYLLRDGDIRVDLPEGKLHVWVKAYYGFAIFTRYFETSTAKPFVIEVRAYHVHLGGRSLLSIGWYYSDEERRGYWLRAESGADDVGFLKYEEGGWWYQSRAGVYQFFNKWFWVIVKVKGSNFFGEVKTEDGSLDVRLSGSDSSFTSGNILLNFEYTENDEEYYVDWVRVRKFADVEPTYTFSPYSEFEPIKPTSVKLKSLKELDDTLSSIQRLYNTLASVQDFKIALLRKPLTAALTQLTPVFMIKNLLRPLIEQYNSLQRDLAELNKTLASITGLPTPSQLFKANFQLVKVKTDLLLLNTTLSQLKGVVEKIKVTKACKEDAEKDLNALLSAKNLLEFIKVKTRIIPKYGSAEKLVKCYITNTLLKIKEVFKKVEKDLLSSMGGAKGMIEMYAETLKELGKAAMGG